MYFLNAIVSGLRINKLIDFSKSLLESYHFAYKLPKDGASLVSDMAQLLASDLSEFLLSICDLIE